MLTSKELLKVFYATLSEELQNGGYKKKRTLYGGYLFSKELRNDFVGYIGTGQSSHGLRGVQYINVLYSLSNQRVQKLLASLLEVPLNKAYNSMNSLSCLTPGISYNDLEICITDEASIISSVSIIKSYINKYIEPFFNENDNWMSYELLLRSGKLCWYSEKIMLIPIMMYLEGKKDNAISYIKNLRQHSDKAYNNNILDKRFLINFGNLLGCEL